MRWTPIFDIGMRRFSSSSINFKRRKKEMKLALLVKPNERDYHLLLGDVYYKLGKKGRVTLRVPALSGWAK